MKSLITSGGRIWGEVNKGRDRYTSSVRYPFQFQMCIVQQSNLSLEPKPHTLLHARHLEYLNTCSKLLSLTRNALVGLHSKLNPRCRLLMKYDQFRTNKLKGTVSRYCTCTKLWFLDRMSRNQKMPGEWENLETSVCIARGQVQYYTKTSQDYRSMIYCSC